jgi:hypothetical protein
MSYITMQDWDHVRELLSTPQGIQLCRDMKDDSDLTILGLALGWCAPIDIVKSIIEINPNAVGEVDIYHASALHICCLNGTSVDVVKLLLQNGNQKSLYAVDHRRRVPLHHAVDYACRPRDPDDDVDIDETIDVIRYLHSLAPELLYFEDRCGDNPMDLPHIVMFMCENPFSPQYRRAEYIYHQVRNLSVDYYKKKKKSYELIGWDFERHKPAIHTPNSCEDSCSKSTAATDLISYSLTNSTSHTINPHHTVDAPILYPPPLLPYIEQDQLMAEEENYLSSQSLPKHSKSFSMNISKSNSSESLAH